MDVNQQPERSSLRPGVVAAGGILLAMGIAMMLDTTGAIDIRMGRLIGPLFLILLGASMMFDKSALVAGRRMRDDDGRVRMRLRRRGGQRSGLWLIGIGAWMMVSQMHLFGLNYGNSWPLVIILAGVMMMIRGAR
jgi:cell wall-active antibiotic response 4TMS protein YvqF